MEEKVFIFKTKKRYITEILIFILLSAMIYKDVLTWNYFLALLIVYLNFKIFFIQQLILDDSSICLNHSYLLFFLKSPIYIYKDIVKVKISDARVSSIKFTLVRNSKLISKSYLLEIRPKDLEKVEKILKEHSIMIDNQLPSFFRGKNK